MKLSLSFKHLETAFQVTLPESKTLIRSVAFDTRRIVEGEAMLFFALTGEFRDGHDFIGDAYQKGVRTFVISKKIDEKQFPSAVFITLKSPLKALQVLAKLHRAQFAIPVIAITGSAGKTMVKEWLGQVLDTKFRVVRSPKSYNSQLGVALSLFEINEECDIAIIEAGISAPGEMAALEEMIRPTLGIFTSLGSAHRENFESRDQHLAEKMLLFQHCKKVFVHHSIPYDIKDPHLFGVHEKSYASLLEHLPFEDEISRHNAVMVVAASRACDITDEAIAEEIAHLDRVALRLETFDGKRNCVIINDTYNLDQDAFRSSLEYQLSIAKGRHRVVVIGTQEEDPSSFIAVLDDFSPLEYHFVDSPDASLPEFENAVVLIKGKRALHMEQLASRLSVKKHQTYVEINLSALRNNVSYFKSLIPSETKVLAMVKASSYGSGIDEIGMYLERIGIHYLGVAYADEGVQLREAGVQLPILVMNTEESGFEDCILHNLEPCIYSLDQLEKFTRRLLYEGRTNYPIHVKLETGMNRLGLQTDDIPALLRMIQSQPEIHLQSVYSHLATSDEPTSSFVHDQARLFEEMSAEIQRHIPYAVDRHILNSEGVLNFAQYAFEMVRVGIGMYGYTSNNTHSDHLKNVVAWNSAISQIRTIHPDQSVGYGRKGKSEKQTQIAVIPVGYADGFRRSLSNGKGGVYIQGAFCPVIGNVCMDMIMVDLGASVALVGDAVEIIGPHQSLTDLAHKMDTIPYEVLTSISKRVHRIYVEN